MRKINFRSTRREESIELSGNKVRAGRENGKKKKKKKKMPELLCSRMFKEKVGPRMPVFLSMLRL